LTPALETPVSSPLPILFVVSHPDDLLPEDPNSRSVLSADYLAGLDPSQRAARRVVNLCREHDYLSDGYYVSLIADARGQDVEPTIDVLVGLEDTAGTLRALQEAGIPIAEEEEWGETVEARILGGAAQQARFRTIGRRIHQTLPFPALAADLKRTDRGWRVLRVRALGLADLDGTERSRLQTSMIGRRVPGARPTASFTLGVLWNELDPYRPSNRDAIDRLVRVGARMGVLVDPLDPDELHRVPEHDALLIRAVTGVEEPAFAFAQRAESLGMPVIDDPRSILRCCNKVYLHELLGRAGLATPPTVLASASTTFAELTAALGCPVVVKLPDGSFSVGVKKVSDEAGWKEIGAKWFADSPLLVVQKYLPTAFDWRVGVLDGRPLFVARYHMAKGHWQIARSTANTTRYGRVEAVSRSTADPEVVALACAAASLVGDGLYGVDLKETDAGVVVIEINDNPNLDAGNEDAVDGERIYEDLIRWYAARVDRPTPLRTPSRRPDRTALRTPITSARPPVPAPYKAYEVVGLELEYPVVDDRLEPVGLVADVLREVAGYPTSDVELGHVAISNEIVDHVLELKTQLPLASLVDTELVLAELVRRLAALLAERGARLMPTGMHPWLDPKRTRLWSRSGRRIYATYARLFDVRTHGWANVQATHVNLPVGTDAEAVAMMNAASKLVPYLPALAASSPMYGGRMQPAVDNRLAFIIEHQARIKESCGDIVPEPIESLAGYKKDVLGPMYAAVDRLPDAGLLRREFFNARGAVFKFSRDSMEVRVLDTQECVRMDVAVAAFVRHGLKWLALRGGPMPDHALLVQDFQACVRSGSDASVRAPHLGGPGSARDALGVVLAGARELCPAEEQGYLDLIAGVIREGSLSERMASFLRPHADDPEALQRAARRIYEELTECLAENRPWAGRNL
jgi:glutathione synthase/RimK-type ligase-like ATP-grasp enzyme/gamma-glutamyl:cysteine ligase YbdK (ATP-grasp superfamily)